MAVHEKNLSFAEEQKLKIAESVKNTTSLSESVIPEKKVEFLNYKNYVQEKDFGGNEEAKQQAMQTLATIETALNDAEVALEDAKTTALNGIDKAKTSVTTAYNKIVDKISEMGKNVNDLLDKAGSDINGSIENFETSFKENYSKYQEKAKQEWEKMRTMLIDGYQENK